MSKSKQVKAREQAEACERLRGIFTHPAIMPVYTSLRHVSTSGMMRVLKVHVAQNDEILNLSGWVADATGSSWSDRYDGIIRRGCGMDMGFDLVYSLSRALWPQGYPCDGRHCSSNDHSNSPYPERSSESAFHHTDGGYRLQHKWLY